MSHPAGTVCLVLTIATSEDSYILGLWRADGYHRSSSIGLSNTDPDLIFRFGLWLNAAMPAGRLRLRVYQVDDAPIAPRLESLPARISIVRPSKMRRNAYHVYVNCRPLLRAFLRRRDAIDELPAALIGPYFAGRFDGDGSFGSKRVPGSRIAYSSRIEAERDRSLLAKIGIDEVTISHYSAAAEFCIYVKKPSNPAFLGRIAPFSSRISSN